MVFCYNKEKIRDDKMDILIQHTYLIAGGIEKALLNFLNVISKETNIDLFLFNRVGVLKDDVPENVNVLQANSLMKKRVSDVQHNVEMKKQKPNIKQNIKKILKFFGINKLYSSYVLKSQEKLEKHYDVSICFNGFVDGCKYVLKKTKATYKIVIFHSDSENVPLSKQRLKLFSKFDKILCVSQSCANVFKQKYPKLSNKVDFLYNMQNNNEILKKSEEYKVNYSKIFNIVSVSRLSEEKAYIRTLEVLKRLKDDGFSFVWNIVGDGNVKSDILEFIAKYHMEKNVVLMGNQSNPYPYIKSADLFLLGSYHEAAPVVYGESMLLGVPVLSTNTRSAKELVADYGFVCENNSESLYESLKQILTNKNLIANKKEKLKNYVYDNDKIKNKFFDIVR